MTPEYARWAPVHRAGLGTELLSRIPGLINSPGITQIDGVPIGAPYFNENKPLRNRPPVTNTVAEAIEIQQAFEMQEWVSQSGYTVTWAQYVREAPLLGLHPKPVIYQFAKADQQSVNPGTTAILRAGNLADWATHYRHDLAFAEDPTIPKTRRSRRTRIPCLSR
jgi:hypothetical protein